MKTIISSLITALGIGTGAFAADLPSRIAPVPVMSAVPALRWTGFYAGVNAGYGWRTNDKVSVGGFEDLDLDTDGSFIGGGQIGYNHQLGSFVIGIEADLQYAGFDSARQISFPDPLSSADIRFNDDLDWFGTVRARAGVAVDRVLVYATAGLSYSGGGNAASEGLADRDDASLGWVLGAGVEYAITNNLVAGVEGLWVDSGRKISAVTITEPGVRGIFESDSDHEFFIARAKLNVRFNTY